MEQRSTRKTLVGLVTSKTGDKSLKVVIYYKVPHPLYLKEIKRKTVVHVHDESNQASLGDRVEIVETRPISKLKRFRLVNIVEKATAL